MVSAEGSRRRVYALKRERKQRGIGLSATGIIIGFFIAMVFRVAGYWTFELSAWFGLLGLTVVIHVLFWIALRRGLDRLVPWDPHFVYVPSLAVIALFCLFVLAAPEARVLIPFGFFVNLLFLVGLAGLVETTALSLAMAVAYFAVALVVARSGVPLALGYEAIVAGLLFALGSFAGTVLERARRRREDLLQTTSQLRTMSRAVEQSPSLLILTDVEGAIEYVNPKFTEITGFSLEEVRGKTPRILKSPATEAEVHEEMWETISSGREWRGELQNLKKDGQPYWVLASVSPIRDERGEIRNFLGVQEDITERKRVESRLAQAQKMEGVGQLVSGVAHDFNNLLTGVLGFADLALSRLADDDPMRGDLLQIKRAGESASSLTQQLLAFSRQQMLAPKILDLNEVVGAIVPLLRRSVHENIELVTDPEPELERVRADPAQIQQILMNLAVNARDAMPDGGQLRISTANVELSEDFGLDAFNVRPGSYVRLSVSDTGCGMSEEVRTRVFEPFFTTKERGRGTGLGLATVFGIVKQNAGYVVVESELGRGSTFSVYLPCIEERGGALPEKRFEPDEVGGSERILLVEDDEVVRGLSSKVLASHGYRVMTADGPAAALAMANGSRVDLLVTDVVMPEMSGVQLAERLRRRRPDLKVLLLSGYSAQETLLEIAADPALLFLSKPFDNQDLLRTVRHLLDATT